jgi:putative hydrolase of the HAD superfamily
MYRLYDDALPTLDILRSKGYRMGIISNHEWGLPRLITGLGLGRYFDAVVSSARVGYRKPHPEIFRFVLDDLGGSADQALMIGDSISSDVKGAIRMGMSVVLVDRDGTSTPVDGVPVVGRLSELLEFL